MDNYAKTETRSHYTGITPSIHPMFLKGIMGSADRTDWDATKVKPFTDTSLRDLFEERSLQPESDTHNSWNDFEHYKVVGEFLRQPTRYYTRHYSVFPFGHTFVYDDNRVQWSDSAFGTADNPISGLPLLYEKSSTTGRFVKTVPSINTLINVAVRQMLGQARPDLSLINSIIELKDFRRLPQQIRQVRAQLVLLKRDLPIILAALGNVYPRGKATFLRILSVMSNALLQQEFNIKPLLADIEDIRNVCNTVRQRILKRMRDDGVRRRRDYNITLSSDFKDSYERSSNYAKNNTLNINFPKPSGVTGDNMIERTVRYSHRLFHAQVEYSHYYTEFQRQNALLLGLLDRIGVNFDPRIVWNAIPWSFAVDWLVSVNSWLGQFRTANLEPVTLIHKFCWSQRVKRTIHCTLNAQHSLPSTHRPPPRIASSITEDAYIRNTQRLNVVAALSGSGINPKEFILASALALSRNR